MRAVRSRDVTPRLRGSSRLFSLRVILGMKSHNRHEMEIITCIDFHCLAMLLDDILHGSNTRICMLEQKNVGELLSRASCTYHQGESPLLVDVSSVASLSLVRCTSSAVC